MVSWYPLTPVQGGMLFDSLYDPSAGVGVSQCVIDVEEALCEGEFEWAWRQAVAAHPALRTAFRWGDGEAPVQCAHAHVDLPIAWHDWSTLR